MSKNARAFKKTLNYENEIWNIANLVRDIIPRTDYNKVILPFVLIRRLEETLEPTREKVCKAFEEHEEDWGRESENYYQYSKTIFYNITEYRLGSLNKTDTYLQLMEYINGFSENAREVILKFDIKSTWKKLQEHDLLYAVCQKFASVQFDKDHISDRDISNIYEHLIERYNNDIAESADDFMTPKDVVHLCARLLLSRRDQSLFTGEQVVKTIYDQTCGTGGFLVEMMDYIHALAQKNKKKHPLVIPYGEEISNITWAMCKANLLIRSTVEKKEDNVQIKDLSEHIMRGNTLIDDKFPNEHFDYCLSNPPYGKDWKNEEEQIRKEADLGFSGRFGAGVPNRDDGSMLFIQNMVSHMKTAEEGGGKGVIVLSSSPLANGKAGNGMSNIRRWLFQEDLVECIVKLPQYIYYRTIINTYVWILNTKKTRSRKNKVQLINAAELYTRREVTIGSKTRDISDEAIETIVKTYADNKESDISKIVPIKEFMYREITILSPKVRTFYFDPRKIETLDSDYYIKNSYSKDSIEEIKKNIRCYEGQTVLYKKICEIAEEIRRCFKRVSTTKLTKVLCRIFEIEPRDITECGSDTNVEIVPDTNVVFTERIPYDQNIDEYIKKELLSYNPNIMIDKNIKDDWVLGDHKTGVVGAKIQFDKYFYKSEVFRNPNEIMSEIKTLESEIISIMKEVIS